MHYTLKAQGTKEIWLDEDSYMTSHVALTRKWTKPHGLADFALGLSNTKLEVGSNAKLGVVASN